MSTDEDIMKPVGFSAISDNGPMLLIMMHSAPDNPKSLYLTLTFPSASLRQGWQAQNVLDTGTGTISRYELECMRDDGRLVSIEPEVVEEYTQDILTGQELERMNTVHPVRFYMASGAPLFYGRVDRTGIGGIEDFWQKVADLAADFGLSVGGGLLDCDEEGKELSDGPQG